MPFVIWSERFSMGIDTIDAQHRGLIDILNETYDATSECNNAFTSELFAKLVTYTEVHFKTEEDALQNMASPLYGEHKKMHVQFIARLMEMKNEMTDQSPAETREECLTFLKKWLVNHILTEDRKYMEDLKNAGL